MADPANSILLREEPQPPLRRHFLKTLVTAPIAALATHRLLLSPAPGAAGAAAPITNAQLVEYSNWLRIETFRVNSELGWPTRSLATVELFGPAYDWHSADTKRDSLPSQRALAVMAAAGCRV